MSSVARRRRAAFRTDSGTGGDFFSLVEFEPEDCAGGSRWRREK